MAPTFSRTSRYEGIFFDVDLRVLETSHRQEICFCDRLNSKAICSRFDDPEANDLGAFLLSGFHACFELFVTEKIFHAGDSRQRFVLSQNEAGGPRDGFYTSFSYEKSQVCVAKDPEI